MAIQFHPLPLGLFDAKQRPYIERLNKELLDLFGLEGSLRNPTTKQRSDATVVRHGGATVDASRITPSIASVIAGSSTVVGIPALTLGTANAAGSTTTAIATNSSVAIFGTQAPLGSTYAATVGTSAAAARGDHRHQLSDTLLVIGGTTKTLTLSDGGVNTGALLSPSSSFSDNWLSLMAPNGTEQFTLGQSGTITLGTASPSNEVLFNGVLNHKNASTTVLGGQFNITNTAEGAVSAIIKGFDFSISGTCATASADTNRQIIGVQSSLTGGATGNSKFTGTLTGFRMGTCSVNSSTVGTSVTSLIGLDAFATVNPTVIRSVLTNMYGVQIGGNPTLSLSGTLGTLTGVRVEALQKGTTRYGLDVAAIGTGTATYAAGVNVATHSIGTVRRSLRGGNSIELDNCFIAGVSGMGFIVKDIADGNFYLCGTSNGVWGTSSLGTTMYAL